MGTYDGKRFHKSLAVSAGTTSAPVFLPEEGDFIVALFPGVGGSMYAEASISDPNDVAGGTAKWVAMSGPVTADALQAGYGPVTAVRFVATTADGVAEVKQ